MNYLFKKTFCSQVFKRNQFIKNETLASELQFKEEFFEYFFNNYTSLSEKNVLYLIRKLGQFKLTNSEHLYLITLNNQLFEIKENIKNEKLIQEIYTFSSCKLKQLYENFSIEPKEYQNLNNSCVKLIRIFFYLKNNIQKTESIIPLLELLSIVHFSDEEEINFIIEQLVQLCNLNFKFRGDELSIENSFKLTKLFLFNLYSKHVILTNEIKQLINSVLIYSLASAELEPTDLESIRDILQLIEGYNLKTKSKEFEKIEKYLRTLFSKYDKNLEYFLTVPDNYLKYDLDRILILDKYI